MVSKLRIRCVKVGIKALAERSRLELIRSIGNVLDSLPLFLWALFTAVGVQAAFDCSGRLRRLWCVCANPFLGSRLPPTYD